MPPTSRFLEISVVWNDDDLQEVVVAASSGRFTGQVNLYAGPREFESIVECLRGFPSGRADRREVRLGQDGLPGYGTANLSIYCTDSTGHVAIEVAMRTFPVTSPEAHESAVVMVPVTIGDLDQFLSDLRSLNNLVGARVVLRSAA